jgi:hypothetical protein
VELLLINWGITISNQLSQLHIFYKINNKKMENNNLRFDTKSNEEINVLRNKYRNTVALVPSSLEEQEKAKDIMKLLQGTNHYSATIILEYVLAMLSVKSTITSTLD